MAGVKVAIETSMELKDSRSHRLRGRRIRVEELKLGEITARASHGALGAVTAAVEDLSLYGLALVMNCDPGSMPLVLPGDRLEPFAIECTAGVLYTGTAVVRRVSPRGDEQLVIGIELESRGIDLGDLYRRETRHSFGARWEAAEGGARHDGIATVFKAWVADLRAYLEAIHGFLQREERALAVEDETTRRETLDEFLNEAAPRVISRMNIANSELSMHVAQLDEEQHAGYRAFFRAQVGELLMHSPIFRRARSKPLGYSGDYEVMNMLYRDHAEGDSTFGKALNMYAAQESAARAVINRISYLQNKIREAVASHAPKRTRVASIGCGPAREIARLLEEHPGYGPHLEVALIDQDERSISYCERTLAPLAARTGVRLQFIRESIRRLLSSGDLSETLGARELIYSAGLFDYLNNRQFGNLSRALYDAVVPGGKLVIGNVAIDNPTRWIMEYFLDWFVIHRTPEDLAMHAAALQPAAARVTVESEPLGVNLFLLVER